MIIFALLYSFYLASAAIDPFEPPNSLTRTNQILQDIDDKTGGGSGGGAGKASVALARNAYSSTNVTTATYVQILASTSDAITEEHIFDSSGQTLYFAVGAAGSEVNQFLIEPGGNGEMHLAIPAASRLSVKAVSANATVGELDMSFFK